MGVPAYSNAAEPIVKTPTKILILDDDAFDRKRMRRWVERVGCGPVDMVEALGLESFAQCLRAGEFDLVLVDFALADGTGLDALDLLRGCLKNAESYVVMVSGREDRTLKDTCLAQGCDAFVTKSDLDVSVLSDLVKAAQQRDLEPDLPRRLDGQTALEFWRQRANLRARRDNANSQEDNITVLRDLLGVKELTPAIPEQNQAEGTIPIELSRKLRSFLDDFLAPDEFTF